MCSFLSSLFLFASFFWIFPSYQNKETGKFDWHFVHFFWYTHRHTDDRMSMNNHMNLFCKVNLVLFFSKQENKKQQIFFICIYLYNFVVCHRFVHVCLRIFFSFVFFVKWCKQEYVSIWYGTNEQEELHAKVKKKCGFFFFWNSKKWSWYNKHIEELC